MISIRKSALFAALAFAAACSASPVDIASPDAGPSFDSSQIGSGGRTEPAEVPPDTTGGNP